MTRARGWIEWRPRAETALLVAQIQNVLEEYRVHVPLTLRQIFYRLVGAHGFAKDERAYKRLADTVGKARRSRQIDMAAVRDDGTTREGGHGWSSKADLIAYWRRQAMGFRMDRQAGQPAQLYLWCEAGGMVPQLARVADTYDVPVLSSGGFDSLTMKHELATEFARHDAVQVLHVGDHDPSGVHIFSSLAEDIQAFALAAGVTEVTFTRLVVTPAQIAEYGLPTAPPKTTDNRAFEGETTQAEALPPDVLARLVGEAIVARVDPAARAEVLAAEVAGRAELLAFLERGRTS